MIIAKPFGRLRDHSFSTYSKFSEKLTFCTCAFQGVRNSSFSGNFAHVLDGWSLIETLFLADTE